jgi:L-amino acid N-acyltransferase YncA
MVIRPARAEDFPSIAVITNHYIANSSIHFGYEPVSEQELRNTWDASSQHVWLVAEDVPPGQPGAVLGYAKSGVWRERAAYAWTAELGLYVAQHARGRGLGTALYLELLAELEQRRFRSAVAGIVLPNDASIRLHQKLGFQRVGTFVDAGWKKGSWHAVDWWQKRFATDDRPPPE